MRSGIYLFILSLLCLKLGAQVTIEVDAKQEGTDMSQDLVGAFFEDINYGADGGLYAELVQNRSFEYYPVAGYTDMSQLTAWSVVEQGGAEVSIQVDNAIPLNDKNKNYLSVNIAQSGSRAGVANSGYDGIPVKAGEKYDFSVFMRSKNLNDSPVFIQLKTPSGNVIASANISAITNEWTKYELELEPSQTEEEASLHIFTLGSGVINMDMVSLFPQKTFKNRRNGLRPDLAQAIADLKPQFLRFPGGCISHGRGLDNAYRWKETVGNVEAREANWNLWGYHQTYGLGFYEYFVYSEDIGAMPLPVLPVGISCQFRGREIAPISEMGPWIQDALDLIEFANGDTTTEWGSLRAEMGHPEPFNMEYLCLGNEEDDIPEFRERFKMFVDTLRKYHPEIKIIGTSGTDDTGSHYTTLWEFSRHEELDAVDEHYYNDPDWFLNNVHRYDNFDRNGPKVFIGEYASRDDRLYNAIAEAAYLTGVERNADIIEFTCYAPLLSNVNHQQWHPDLIRFNNTGTAKTASYYVQQLYGVHAGDTYLSHNLEYDENYSASSYDYTGKTGVGTWSTQAAFDDFKVTSGGQVLIDENFESGAANWQALDGYFSVSNGTYVQSANSAPAWSVANTEINAKEYTISLKAMKTGGAEGFLIPFAYRDNGNYYWLNLGGWGNSLHAIEKATNGGKSTLASKGGSLQNNVWYNIRIEVGKETVNVYLNDEFLFNIPPPPGPVTASFTKDEETNELIVKLVNSGDQSIEAALNIDGYEIDQNVEATVLTGNPGDRNSISNPDLIKPFTQNVQVTDSFTYSLPAYSFHVFRIKMIDSTVGIDNREKKVDTGLKIIPNPTDGQAQIYFPNPENEEFRYSIYNAAGCLVAQKDGITESMFTLKRKSLPNGAYIITLTSKDRIYKDKISLN